MNRLLWIIGVTLLVAVAAQASYRQCVILLAPRPCVLLERHTPLDVTDDDAIDRTMRQVGYDVVRVAKAACRERSRTVRGKSRECSLVVKLEAAR